MSHEELSGVESDFISALKRADNGMYILGVDYPTYTAVMENCSCEQTRKKLFLAFTNRAYPANDHVLKRVIAARDELAQLLGFASYAQYDLDDKMIGSPELAYAFLNNALEKANVKEQQEFALLTLRLPESVQLTADGKLKPWDSAYLKTCYKKKHLAVDEHAIAEYFPVEETLARIFATYQQFLSLEFRRMPFAGGWHDDLYLIEVYQHGDLFGVYYPRPLSATGKIYPCRTCNGSSRFCWVTWTAAAVSASNHGQFP